RGSECGSCHWRRAGRRSACSRQRSHSSTCTERLPRFGTGRKVSLRSEAEGGQRLGASATKQKRAASGKCSVGAPENPPVTSRGKLASRRPWWEQPCCTSVAMSGDLLQSQPSGL